MFVDTVSGRVPADHLGMTLMHEHVFTFSPTGPAPGTRPWEEQSEVARAIKRLNQAKARGVGGLVDLTVPGLGRDIARIRQVATGTDVNVIAATGLYAFDDVPPGVVDAATARRSDLADVLARRFIDELTAGIDDTGIRAGVIKCCTDEPGLTTGVEVMLRAAARAHVATGAPISTHTNGRYGQEQIAIFRREGVDLTRVVIGHSGARSDMNYLESIVDTGASAGMDQFGMDYVPPEKRINAVVTLVRRGYVERLVLSHDFSSYTDTFVPPSSWTSYGYVNIPEVTVPALLRAGCTPTDIEQMLVHNPRRLLASRLPAESLASVADPGGRRI